jgi:hypothetical protein
MVDEDFGAAGAGDSELTLFYEQLPHCSPLGPGDTLSDVPPQNLANTQWPGGVGVGGAFLPSKSKRTLGDPPRGLRKLASDRGGDEETHGRVVVGAGCETASGSECAEVLRTQARGARRRHRAEPDAVAMVEGGGGVTRGEAAPWRTSVGGGWGRLRCRQLVDVELERRGGL